MLTALPHIFGSASSPCVLPALAPSHRGLRVVLRAQEMLNFIVQYVPASLCGYIILFDLSLLSAHLPPLDFFYSPHQSSSMP